jgi:hypothetical protein
MPTRYRDSIERAFGGLDWREELSQDSDVSYHLNAEADGGQDTVAK